MQHVEIERKYLLRAPPPLPAHAEVWRIEQGYLPDQMGRLRRTLLADGREVLTYTRKSGSGLVRNEIEHVIDRAEFEALWPQTANNRLRKTRHRIRDLSVVWEIDTFSGIDLTLAEIELPAADAAVVIPPWLQPFVVREVTDDPAFANASIASRAPQGC